MALSPDRAEGLIRDFVAAWERRDVDGIVEFFTDDAVYHNIPMAPCKGREEIRTFIAGFVGTASSVQFEILHQVCQGNLVMNERVDTLALATGTVALPVMGVFELTDDGKIARWRDYFDMASFTGN